MENGKVDNLIKNSKFLKHFLIISFVTVFILWHRRHSVWFMYDSARVLVTVRDKLVTYIFAAKKYEYFFRKMSAA